MRGVTLNCRWSRPHSTESSIHVSNVMVALQLIKASVSMLCSCLPHLSGSTPLRRFFSTSVIRDLLSPSVARALFYLKYRNLCLWFLHAISRNRADAMRVWFLVNVRPFARSMVCMTFPRCECTVKRKLYLGSESSMGLGSMCRFVDSVPLSFSFR